MRKIEKMDVVVNLLVFLAIVVTLYPIINVVALSLSSDREVLLHPQMLFPRDLTFSSYKVVFKDPMLYSSYFNTILVTVVSSFIGIVLTTMAAYSLARQDLAGRTFLFKFLLVTMYFGGSGQMIPSFILVRQLGMYDSLWALIIPGCVSTFYLILLINFFRNDSFFSLIESAKIDGASEPYILVRIVMPISKASMATILLFYMVNHWNSFFNAVLYISSRDKWPLQLFLRELITSVNTTAGMGADAYDYISPTNIRTAALVISIVPIVIVYPFMQKYFVKGMMVGSVKG